ncbi:MAG: hypothetical protein BGO55_00480 [Sphingobacteriales bacterium 50-39]|nr:hypothetical protein [Sphingobacteriales bacterium]OJW53590.1 MAG: hypothetical protein BGO55_00480 [Sphingobacteriales bacterium 50-39]
MATIRDTAGTDPRYKDVEFFLKSGRIKTFLDIFRTIPRTVVATDLGMKTDRFADALNDESVFSLWHYRLMAKWMQIEIEEFMALVFDHYLMIELGGKVDVKKLTLYDAKHRGSIDYFQHEPGKKDQVKR